MPSTRPPRPGLPLLIAALTLPLPPGPAPASGADGLAGRRIYREGRLDSGAPLVGAFAGDVKLRGSQAACAKCHRRSGLGSIEAGKFTPRIAGPDLFREAAPDRAESFRRLYQEPKPELEFARVRIPRIRPAYDDRTLARAIRTGVDPTGRALDPLMPRYDLTDADMNLLTAYLKTLGAAPAPGVDDQTIHFATVVTPDAPADQREAMLEVIRKFVADENLEMDRYRSRPGVSPHYKSDLIKGYRRWSVHVWELEGRPETFAEQLDRRLASRPVFALLRGISGGGWRAIQEYCDRREIPCLFPQVVSPPQDAEGGATLYLTRGLPGEAAVLAAYLRRRDEPLDDRRILQVHRADSIEVEAADSLRLAVAGAASVETLVLAPSDDPTGLILDRIGASTPRSLVLWLPDADLTAPTLEAALKAMDGGDVFIPSGSVDEPLSARLRRIPDGVSLIHPYELPQRRVPQVYRLRSWMQSRRIPQDHDRIRLDTYFALSVAAHALTQLVDRYSRDFFVERIEHETENSLNPGIYPRLSLGPGQRFASKGGYVLRVSAGEPNHFQILSEWITP